MTRTASITFHIEYEEWEETQFERRKPEGWDRDSIQREALLVLGASVNGLGETIRIIDTEYEFEPEAL